MSFDVLASMQLVPSTGTARSYLKPLMSNQMLIAGCAAPFGIEGWRFSFLSVALVSAAIGVLTYVFGEDPRDSRRCVCRLAHARTHVCTHAQLDHSQCRKWSLAYVLC